MLNFSFNSKNSQDFGLLVVSSDHLSPFNKKIEIVEVPGRTGALVIDEGSYSNKIVNINCKLKTDSVSSQINKITNWLNSNKGYSKLVINDGFSFNAVYTGVCKIAKLHDKFFSVDIQFSCEEVI